MTAIEAPITGPATGIHEYDHSLCPFVLMGKIKWDNRGPRSRAGLIAYPVGPPRDSPMPNTSNATGNAFNVPSASEGGDMARAPNIKTKVATISVMRLYLSFRMAGVLQNTARTNSLSSVASKCSLYINQTRQLPTMAPDICART